MMSNAIKMREESIVTNEQRFRDLVNSIAGIVWEMEYPSFRFLFVSKQAETILGYPLQDWYEVESFWEQKMHAEDLAQAKSYCQLMSEKHEDHDFEYRMVAADGRIVWIRDLVTVVVEDNRPVRLLGARRPQAACSVSSLSNQRQDRCLADPDARAALGGAGQGLC